MSVVRLSTGADARLTGDVRAKAVVCVDGGSGREVEGDWSATLEWLVRRLAPDLPGLAFAEVRYRVKSWRRLDLCLEDGQAALDLVVERGASSVALLGFSLGGAISIGLAGHPAVTDVVGLAPWIPDRMDVSTLDGKRLAVVHGRLDAWLPGIPGVSPRHTLRGLERIARRGTEVSHTFVSGAVHGVAVHGPFGTLVPLPRARRWARLVRTELERFSATARDGGELAARRSGA